MCVRGETHALPFVERRAHSWGDAHTRGDAHSRWRDVHTRGEKCAALIRIVIRTELIYIIDVDGKKCVFTVDYKNAHFHCVRVDITLLTTLTTLSSVNT